MHSFDNPVWTALTTRQQHLAEGDGLAKKFPSEISPLAALVAPTPEAWRSLAELAQPGQAVALITNAPAEPPAGWEILRSAPLLQMMYEGETPARKAKSFLRLGAADAAEMVALAELTKPGPFALRTPELGTYIGVRREGRLVAMGGERLRLPGYTEISGVCTHPEHIGKGHAAALIAELIEGIRSRGEQPFLHVREANTRAAGLYRHLGFRDRVLLHVTVLKKPALS